MKGWKNFVILGTVLALMGSCWGGSTEQNEVQMQVKQFEVPEPPYELSAEEQGEWLKSHYWDQFDFSDTLSLAQMDTMSLVNAYARYIAVISDEPHHGAWMDSLMKRASQSRTMLDYFAWLGEAVLHDPNSPMRNDEFYIPVLKYVLASPYYNEYERIAPEFDMKVVSQNRIGRKANDVVYTLASGKKGHLYNIEAEYTLLLISNPACPMCGEVLEALQSSPMLNELVEMGRLKILVLYPDKDLTEWRKHRAAFPKQWIYAYDDGCKMESESLYNLSAIPSMYLLDRQKRVLVKDSVDVPYIEEVIDRRQ